MTFYFQNKMIHVIQSSLNKIEEKQIWVEYVRFILIFYQLFWKYA